MKVPRKGVPPDCSPTLATAKPCVAKIGMPKDTWPGDVVKATEKVLQGASSYNAEVARVRLSKHAEKLSPRERQVLVAIAEGLTNKQIANLLGNSVRTVEMHRARLMRKLNIHNVAGLTRFAISKGWLPSSQRSPKQME